MIKELKNLKSVDKSADIFLDGNVIGRNMVNEEGQNCSLGFVLPGEYEITIEDSETVEVLGGDFTILLPDSDEFVAYDAGDAFYIAENGTYKLKVKDFFDYYCIFGL